MLFIFLYRQLNTDDVFIEELFVNTFMLFVLGEGLLIRTFKYVSLCLFILRSVFIELLSFL